MNPTRTGLLGDIRDLGHLAPWASYLSIESSQQWNFLRDSKPLTLPPLTWIINKNVYQQSEKSEKDTIVLSIHLPSLIYYEPKTWDLMLTPQNKRILQMIIQLKNNNNNNN